MVVISTPPSPVLVAKLIVSYDCAAPPSSSQTRDQLLTALTPLITGLMEEKGMHQDPGSKASKETQSSSFKEHESGGDKPSFGDRIKAKFHKS
jgi:hypothetical protein